MYVLFNIVAAARIISQLRIIVPKGDIYNYEISN